MKQKNPVAFLVGWIALALTPGHASEAANSTATGTTSGSIKGRVLNLTSNTYLNNARVVVVGTTLQTFTDESGEFRLDRVPNGSVSLEASYQGLAPQTAVVTVEQDRTAWHEFRLTRTQYETVGNTAIMDEFVVAANREYNAQAIAINEQRFAPNIKNVVSADEFGDIGESNIGEFIKFMPGLTVNYSVGVLASDISVRGLPSATTLVTLDGAPPANTSTSATSRVFNISQLQVLNNVARIEVLKSPTPDTPANMLGGVVNIINKNAFEQPRPVFSYRIAAVANSRNPWGTGVVQERWLSNVRPAVDFGYILPLSKTLGFTLTGSYNSRLTRIDLGEETWNLVQLRQTGYSVDSSPQLRTVSSGGVSVDWKPAENHVLSGSLTLHDQTVDSSRAQFVTAIGGTHTGDPTFTQSVGAIGSATQSGQLFDGRDQTWHGAVKYRYTGRSWRVDANAFYSSSTSKARDKGSFGSVSAVLPNVVVRYDEIGGMGRPGPSRISTTRAPGAAVDVWDANNYELRTTTGLRRSAQTVTSGGLVNVGRQLDFTVPIALKAGVYLNRGVWDRRNLSEQWTFLGPDGIQNNADNLVSRYDFISEQLSSDPMPYGFPSVRAISPRKIFSYYTANPGQFVYNETSAIISKVSESREITETISAAFLRGDVKLIQNRLKIVGGVRFERTADEGFGALNDPRATLRQDANGNLMRDAQGRTIPITTDAVERTRLQYTERGAYAKRSYHDYFPSLNGSFNATDSIIVRVAYAQTIGRPNFNNIIPGITVTDPDATNPTITVSNTGLRPWSARAYDLSVEKYFANNGIVSLGFFRKDIVEFFGSVRRMATAGELAEYGLTDDYLGYEIATTSNVGEARINGIEANYRQALTFLPSWARGIQVFANGTYNDLDGDRDADFGNFARRTANWGFSLTRSRFSAKLNWSGNGDIRNQIVNTSGTIPPETYLWTPHRTTLDASFEVRLHKKFSLFGTARNLTDRPVRRERYAPDTPGYARHNRYLRVGAFVSLGIKGEF